MQRDFRLFALAPLAIAATLATASLPAAAVSFDVRPLVTDDATAHPAQITDPGLKNAWGVSYAPTGPFWVSSNGAGTSTLYGVSPLTQATSKLGLVVAIPGAGNVTGQVFNSGGASAFNGDNFVFVSEDGTVAGWRGALGTTAEVLQVGSPTNVYKGAATATTTPGNSYLYAANFRAGTIDVLRGNAGVLPLSGQFLDPNLPGGYAPFNVQILGGSLYVTYAVQDSAKTDEVAGAGLGLVDRYDLQGNLVGRVASGGTLNAPWGLAIAPASFGAWAGSLLVGNFGDGRINAYNAADNSFLGQVTGRGGTPLSIDGLWALTPGNDGNAGSSKRLYFTAGPDDESHGMFGVLTVAAVPEPSSALLMALGLTAFGAAARRRRA